MQAKIAVIVTDASKKIQWVNEAFTDITGYTLPEVIGQSPSLLQGEDTEPEAVRNIQKALEAEIPVKESLTNYRKNGERYLCKLAIHPIYNQNRELTNFIAFEIDGSCDDDEGLDLLHIDNKYQSSSLKGRDSVDLFQRLEKLLEQERLYLDPKLSLRELSDRLDTNTKYLSQVVNVHAGVNLQVYINSYRNEAAKKKLLSAELSNLTLYGIAMQCGFKNKSTFYKVFKYFNDCTPMEYVRRSKSWKA